MHAFSIFISSFYIYVLYDSVLANSSEFLESRRKSLRRFLNIIAKHPVIADDRMGVLKFFLTFTGSVSALTFPVFTRSTYLKMRSFNSRSHIFL